MIIMKIDLNRITQEKFQYQQAEIEMMFWAYIPSWLRSRYWFKNFRWATRFALQQWQFNDEKQSF